MELNEKQETALKNLFERSMESKRMTYDEFRATVFPMMADPKVAMVLFAGMIVGIEVDGYTHS